MALLNYCLNNTIDFIVRCNNYNNKNYKCYNIELNKTINDINCQVNSSDFYVGDYNIMNYNIMDYNIREYGNAVVISFEVVFSLFFTLFFISKFIYYPMIQDFINSYDPDIYDYDTFLLKYFEEFDNLEIKDLSIEYMKKLKSKFVKQNTKHGEILLNYDYNNSGFNYYAKTANSIPFEYLEVVARIYVVKYDCKKLYHDSMLDNIKKNSNVCNNDNVENDNNNNENKKSANANANANANVNKIFYSKPKKLLGENIIKKKTNKYKYKGNISHFLKKCKFHNYKISYYQNIGENLDENISENISENIGENLVENITENLDENDTNFSDISDSISDSISNDTDIKNNNSDMEEKFEQISFKDFKKYQEIISKQK